MADEPLVLGIETSCDETGVGIVRGTTLLADAIASSVDEHARFGGVVPEVASRAHLEAMVPTIQRALKDAGVSARDLDGIAVTAGPGLAGALLVGVSAAKAYAYALGKPLYGVNHLASHICVDQLEHGALPEPTMALLVSGGHSSLLLSTDITSDVRPMGATIDDAAGEAFDKIARVLNLGFPGCPVIDRYAKEGDPKAISFPRGLTGPRDPAYDFSFSGLKTSVARWIEAKRAAGEEVPVRDVAASFQEAVVDVLTRKAVRACKDQSVDHLKIGGGVAANKLYQVRLRERPGRNWYRTLAANPLYVAFARGLTFTWFAFTLFWFWSTWGQIGGFVEALGPTALLLTWLAIFVTATLTIAGMEAARNLTFGVTWKKEPLVRSRYVRTAWDTARVVVTLTSIVLLDSPALDIVYKTF